jgi:creatinine amidohydrolase
MSQENPAPVDLDRLTWTQAAVQLAQNPVVLLPVGTLEQNGPGLPLAADTIVATHFSREVARAAGALNVPAVPYGYSAAFMGYAGTISLEAETLRLVVRDVVTSLALHGTSHIVVVNNHGPNEPIVEHALRDVRRRFRIRFAIVWPSRLLRLIAERDYPERVAAQGHGGEPTASVIAALAPDALQRIADNRAIRRIGRILPLTSQSARFEDLPVNLCLDWHEVSSSGATGDSSGADAEWGRVLLNELVRWGVRFVDHFRQESAVESP